MNINNDYIINNTNIEKYETIKDKIVLINTSLPIGDYLNKLTLRFSGNYNKIPAYTVDRCGVVYQHYDPKLTSNCLSDDSLDAQAIVISLENVGWLDNDGCDWRGVKYDGEITETMWRGKKYWATYTNKQFLSLIDLIDYLSKEHNINKKFIGDNVLRSVNHYQGVINRSNFSKQHFDLTPAFEFDRMVKTLNIEYEKFN